MTDPTIPRPVTQPTVALGAVQVIRTVLDDLTPDPDPAVVFASLVESYSKAAAVWCAVHLIGADGHSVLRRPRPGPAADTDLADLEPAEMDHPDDKTSLQLCMQLISGTGEPLVSDRWLAVPIGASAGDAEPAPVLGALVCRLGEAEQIDVHVGIAQTLVAAATQQVRTQRRLARAEQDVDHLKIALASNRDIGTAMGILMGTHLVSQDGAFDLLRRASQHTHRKLRDVAAEVIFTGAIEMPPVRQVPVPSAPRAELRRR